MSTPQITLSPILPQDCLPIATLEAAVFSSDPITVYAFGPHRASSQALQKRADSLVGSPSIGSTIRMRKAVTSEGEIVGFAYWKFLLEEGKEVEKKGEVSREEVKEGNEEKKKEEEEGDSSWGEGANVELRERVFIYSDELCRKSLGGKPYGKLTILAVHPAHQNKGIGSLLLRDGLAEADRLAAANQLPLPVWLGATELAIPLYERFGFAVDHRLEFDMRPYGGSTVEKHTLMIRPAVGC